MSVKLQKTSISLSTAHRMISRQIEVIVARQETTVNYCAEACREVEEGKFKTVEISKEIYIAQFY